MDKNAYFIIDFDSTFIKVEALDELAAISLSKSLGKKVKLDEIQNLTRKAMDGEISFRDSLVKRIALLNADLSHIEKLVKVLKRKISKSIISNKEFFKNYSSQIIIISGGFKEY